MGTLVRNMIPYYDCPQEAIYLPATMYSPLDTVVVEQAICIFEQDTGLTLPNNSETEKIHVFIHTIMSVSSLLTF